MQVEAEYGGAAWHQIALIPPRQIAAGIPLKQRIAVPQGRSENSKGMAIAASQTDRDAGDARA